MNENLKPSLKQPKQHISVTGTESSFSNLNSQIQSIHANHSKEKFIARQSAQYLPQKDPFDNFPFPPWIKPIYSHSF